jgi:transcriptional regulator GlxA family with amidase domain
MGPDKERVCAVFIFDGFADHEVVPVMSWLNLHTDLAIETFSVDGHAVNSLSGLRVIPDMSLRQLDPDLFDLLLLPGGMQWETGDNLEIFPLIRDCAGYKPIAAISEAILVLGDLGLLDDIPHTSPFPDYIAQFCVDYKGLALYRSAPYVDAGGKIITVNGIDLPRLTQEVGTLFCRSGKEEVRDWEGRFPAGMKMQSFFGR